MAEGLDDPTGFLQWFVDHRSPEVAPGSSGCDEDTVLPNGQRTAATCILGGPYAPSRVDDLETEDGADDEYRRTEDHKTLGLTYFAGEPAPDSDEARHADRFNWVKATSLGELIQEPRIGGEVGGTYPPDLDGWWRDSVGKRPCPDPGFDPPPNDTWTQHVLEGENGERTREFVADGMFLQSRSLIRHAGVVVDAVKDGHFTVPDGADSAEVYHDIAWAWQEQFPEFGVWQRGADDVNPVFLKGFEEEDLGTTLGDRIQSTVGGAFKVREKLLGGDFGAVEHFLSNIPNSDLKDETDYYTTIASGATSTADAYAVFPGPAHATLGQDLNPASTLEGHVYVRVVGRFTSVLGNLDVAIAGSSLDISGNIAGAGRPVGERFLLALDGGRAGGATPGVLDHLTLRGTEVEVFSVSVRRDHPVEFKGHVYDFVVVPGGSDWQHAKAHAERSSYEGMIGTARDDHDGRREEFPPCDIPAGRAGLAGRVREAVARQLGLDQWRTILLSSLGRGRGLRLRPN